jgi:glycosyltransferase involved in cell wall biosynthesis
MTNSNIVFVTAYFGEPHGTAKSARDFLYALLACSDRVTVVSPNQEKMPVELCGRPLSRPVWIDTPTGTRLPVLRDWWLGQRWRRFLNRLNGSRLTIVNGWASIGYWRQFAGKVRTTKAMIVRESPRHFADGDYGVELQEVLRVMAEFDVLLFVSERCQKEWLSFPELCGKPAFFVANCCQEEETGTLLKEKRAAVRARLGLKLDEFIVICPGSIERRKGQDLLLEILPELNAGVQNLRVLFIGHGRTDWGRDLLKKFAESNLAPRITHWPTRPGVLDAIYAADALAFPSRAEAMPRTILEAMALKTPLVACAVDGVVELVENHKTGILFGPNDKAALLSGLLALNQNRELSRNLTEAGYARYWKVFSRTHQFARVRDVIDAFSGNFTTKTTKGHVTRQPSGQLLGQQRSQTADNKGPIPPGLNSPPPRREGLQHR